jgi:hypothetical protein
MKKLLLPRPRGSPYKKPIAATLFHYDTEDTLSKCTELILDFPGGGFICMSPLHHEERLLRWTKATKRPILAIDYSKAPEYPYPFAIHESLDMYRLLHETKGKVIGFGRDEIHIIMTGDSAGANLAAAVVYKVLEMPAPVRLPLPVALVFAYPALDFNFGSWMSPNHLKVLRQESMANFKGITQQKDHFSHASPLSVVDDRKPRRKRSWTKSFSKLPFVGSGAKTPRTPRTPGWAEDIPRVSSEPMQMEARSDSEDEEDDDAPTSGHYKSISERVQFWDNETDEEGGQEVNPVTPAEEKSLPSPLSVMGTRLTVGLFSVLHTGLTSLTDDFSIGLLRRQDPFSAHDALDGSLL